MQKALMYWLCSVGFALWDCRSLYSTGVDLLHFCIGDAIGCHGDGKEGHGMKLDYSLIVGLPNNCGGASAVVLLEFAKCLIESGGSAEIKRRVR